MASHELQSSMGLMFSEVAAMLGLPAVADDPLIGSVGIDSRSVRPGELFIAIRGEHWDGHEFVSQAMAAGAVAVIVEHPVAIDLPQLVVDDTHKALAALAVAWRNGLDLCVIGITGSNGKTSVKEMLRAILAGKGWVAATQGNFNNAIGVPLTLLTLRRHHDFAVIEMGASAPGDIEQLTRWVNPDVAVITHAAAAHLAGFGSIKSVALAKGEIFLGLKSGGCAIMNHDDPCVGVWWHLAEGHTQLGFGLQNDAEVRAECIRCNGLQGSQFILLTPFGSVDICLPLPGKHNIANALAAAAAATTCGLSLPEIAKGLTTVKGVNGRLQCHYFQSGLILIDDSYNANPRSLTAALEVLESTGRSQRWLVLGDMGDLGVCGHAMHAQVGRDAVQAGIVRLYALGSLSEWAVESFTGNGQLFSDHDSLLAALLSDLQTIGNANDIVLLVKGSRLSHMERIVAGLCHPEPQPSVGAGDVSCCSM